MKVAIIGQKSFAAAVYKRLDGMGVNISHVFVPDPDDKLALTAHNRTAVCFPLERLKPEDVRGVDLLINAHGFARIEVDVLKALGIGAIGYHPSLLPRHRGRSSIEWTVLMGDPIAGGTVYQLDDGWDTGPILEQQWCHVDPVWDASDLWRERLFRMGLSLLSQAVSSIAWSGAIDGAPQEEQFATYEPPLTREIQRDLERFSGLMHVDGHEISYRGVR